MNSQEFLARGAATLASLKSKQIKFNDFNFVNYMESESSDEEEKIPELSEEQKQQLHDQKSQEDNFTYLDDNILKVNKFRYEIESKGGYQFMYDEV